VARKKMGSSAAAPLTGYMYIDSLK